MDVETRTGRVHCAETGSGPPVVLLHANLHDHRDFDGVAGRLAEHHRVVAVDWPGHGASASPPAGVAVTAPLLADVLEDVVSALDLPAAVYVGNSMGGYAAARLAITQPARVAGLVLVNSGGFLPQNPVTRGFCRFLGSPAVARRVLPRLVPRYMRAVAEHDREISRRVAASARSADGSRLAAGLWRSFADPAYDLRDRAALVSCPTLLVWGARDPVIPLRGGRATARALPNARLETFPTGHVVFASDPEGFLEQVLPFLDAAVGAR
ncbi:MAG: alpha/beta fold hydrolase [Microthrixaceae bacterium]